MAFRTYLTIPNILAATGLGSAIVAGSSGHWALSGSWLSVGLGALALRSRDVRPAANVPSPQVQRISRKHLGDELAARLSADDEVDGLVAQMLCEGRFALLLRPELASTLRQEHLALAAEMLDETMSLVPAGDVCMNSRWLEQDNESAATGRAIMEIEPFFLDRCAVSNAEFARFVEAGGYAQTELWEAAIWPALMQFVDQTGQPAPRFWSGGTYAEGLADHPVVGVSWYEAKAYARWIGKRLPDDAQWVKAGAWPVATSDGAPQQRRYPWGEIFDHSLANVWGCRENRTVPVDEYEQGASVGGIQQLVGNVWEWTNSEWGCWEPPSKRIETIVPMKALRGGAFDTYFENQCACQFQSGDDPLARRHNIGFRCALDWPQTQPLARNQEDT